MRVTNGIPLGSPLLLPVGTVNCVQTLKDYLGYSLPLIVLAFIAASAQVLPRPQFCLLEV
jgi:hypothetical protein